MARFNSYEELKEAYKNGGLICKCGKVFSKLEFEKHYRQCNTEYGEVSTHERDVLILSIISLSIAIFAGIVYILFKTGVL